MRSPISWFGGKGNMTSKLLPFIPDHITYVEVYGGGASLLFAKPPSKVEVYNDLNYDLVNLFRVIRDPSKFEKLQTMLSLTPYSRWEWEQTGDYKEATDDIVRAFKFFIRVRNSFSAAQKGWSYSIDTVRRGMSASVSKHLSIISELPDIHLRLSIVQVECRDAIDILEAYDKENTYFYLDPPYVTTTRVAKKVYEHEMTIEQHIKLLNTIKTCKGMVMLSGYSNAIYNEALKDWNRIEFSTRCVASLVKKEDDKVRGYRTECLWMNYEIDDSKCSDLFDEKEQ
jgi:DNA adenine methylase